MPILRSTAGRATMALLALAGAPHAAPAADATVRMPQQELVPGGVAILPFTAPADQVPQVTFNDRRVLVLRDQERWIAVVGIPLTQTPGPAVARVHDGTLPGAALSFEVADKIVSERNRLLHGVGGDTQISPRILFNINARLRILLYALILTDLGFDTNMTAQRVQGFRDFQWALQQPIDG